MMWSFLETSHFVLLGKYMNTISCKKNENILNGTQDNHFLQCVEFTTEQKICYAIWEERKIDEYPSWRVRPSDIRYSLLLFVRIPKNIYNPPSLKIFTCGNLWKYFFFLLYNAPSNFRRLMAMSNEVAKDPTRAIVGPP